MLIEINPKAARFIVEAIKNEIIRLETNIKNNPDSEDLISDCSNDISYYKAIMQDILSKS